MASLAMNCATRVAPPAPHAKRVVTARTVEAYSRRPATSSAPMPIYFVILLLEIACIVHIMKTGRERYWVLIVFFLRWQE